MPGGLPGNIGPYPLSSKSFGAGVSKSVTSGVTNISTAIEKLELPFETQLKKYVTANDTNIDALINDIKSLLSDLKRLNVTMAKTLLDPSGYDSAYASTILTSLASTITTNLADTGTGLPATTQADMISRARARVNFDAGKEARRITNMHAKMLPYSGGIAVKLKEADRNHTFALNDMNWRITEKEADLTYQFQRDKVRETIAYEQFKLNDHHVNKDRKLRADIALDEMEIRNHWSYFEFLMKRAISQTGVGIDFALKAASGPDQITFENWLKMSRILGDAQLQISSLVASMLP